MKKRILLFLFICLTACTPVRESLPTPVEPTPLRPTESVTLEAPDETPTTAAAATPTAAGLSESGPWLVLITPDGLWAVNEDGTGLTRLTEQRISGPQDIPKIPSPAGGYFAYLTSREIYKDLTLNIHTLPRNLAQTIPLVSPEFQPAPEAVPGDPLLESARAIVEANSSLAWSPDGKSLAFIGILDGPSADVYTFPIQNFDLPPGPERTIGLTDGPINGINPTWSLDGQYIVHTVVSAMGTGAGYAVDSVKATYVDNSGVLELIRIQNTGNVNILGWQGDTEFVYHSWTPHCGNEGLAVFDIDTREDQILWEGPFNGAAYDPDGGGLLVSVDQFTADCGETGTAGLFFLPASDRIPVQLLGEEAFLPNWDPQSSLFFARTASAVFAVRPAGTLFPLQAPEPFLPAGAADGSLAWASSISGVWVVDFDGQAVQVYQEPAFIPAWSPDAQTLFFFSEPGLFVAHAPDFSPVLIGEGLISAGAFWVKGFEGQTDPPGAVAAVIEQAAADLGLDPGALTITSFEPVSFPDSCLGAALPGEACLTVITSGFRVEIQTPNGQIFYHTNESGSLIRRVDEAAPVLPSTDE